MGDPGERKGVFIAHQCQHALPLYGYKREAI